MCVHGQACLHESIHVCVYMGKHYVYMDRCVCAWTNVYVYGQACVCAAYMVAITQQCSQDRSTQQRPHLPRALSVQLHPWKGCP